jgi:hypothetical protein
LTHVTYRFPQVIRLDRILHFRLSRQIFETNAPIFPTVFLSNRLFSGLRISS